MKILLILMILVSVISCTKPSQESRDANVANQQQAQYAKGQPIPTFDWSLERHLVAELYKVRNKRAATHAVWRSNYGTIEGDCPSMGYGLPYDTSLTNPLAPKRFHLSTSTGTTKVIKVVEQAEPNGIFASKNTAATWVLCVGPAGTLEPIYIESKVTIYPGPVLVDYDNNRVTRNGKATVNIRKK